MTTDPPSPAPFSIRLDVLDSTTPHTTYVAISNIFHAAFGSDSPIFRHMYPPPRPSAETMAEVGAHQHVLETRKPEMHYVVAVAVFPDGEEKVAGVALWGRPGYRYKPMIEAEMSEEEKYAYQGYNLEFRNLFRQTLQDHRDKLMGDELYWYLSVLAVHPDYQKSKVGSSLIDQGIKLASSSGGKGHAVLLESSPAGRRLYESRGFVKEDEFPLPVGYEGLEGIKFPLYRRPAAE